MPGHESIPVIGLVGGVGSGKSSLARRLAERRRVVLVDGDAIGHQVLQDPSIQKQIRDRFGESVFENSTQVNRSALARAVFGPTPEHRQAKADLESIVHPEIRREFEQRIAAAANSPGVEGVLLDAAVMLEAGWNDLCDVIVFVEVSAVERSARVRGRGWDEYELKKREASQWPLERKREASQFVVVNSGDLDHSVSQLEQILNQVRRR